MSGQNSDDVVEGYSNVWQDSFSCGQTTSLPHNLEDTVALIPDEAILGVFERKIL